MFARVDSNESNGENLKDRLTPDLDYKSKLRWHLNLTQNALAPNIRSAEATHTLSNTKTAIPQLDNPTSFNSFFYDLKNPQKTIWVERKKPLNNNLNKNEEKNEIPI